MFSTKFYALGIPCDKDGLNRLHEDCLKNGSTIVYLTARYETLRKLTERELLELFPWSYTDKLYMGNGWSKTIPMNIILRRYKHDRCIFVDDMDFNIQDMNNEYGDKVECYKFKC